MKTRTIAIVATVIWVVSGTYMTFLASRWQLDLRVYREAGQLLLHGGDPMKASFTSSHLDFTYSPFALLLFTLFGFAPFSLLESLWWLANSGALVLTLYLLLMADKRTEHAGLTVSERRGMRWRCFAIAAAVGASATLVLEPVRSDIDYGQINFVLMLLVVVGVTSRRATLRGSLVGLAAAIKLTPLVYLGGFLRSGWRSLIRGLGVFVFLAGVTWAVLPTESSEFWEHDLFDASRTGGVGSRSNQSWYGLLQRPPFHGSTAAWVALSVLTVIGGLFVANRALASRKFSEAVAALALTELLVSPVSWTHHWSWLAIVPLAIFSMWDSHRFVAWMLVGLLAVATLAPYWWFGSKGSLTDLTCDSLVLDGAAVLFVWSWAEVQLWWRSTQVGASSDRHVKAGPAL
jgi:alpha-1,2-mannosyltransferase